MTDAVCATNAAGEIAVPACFLKELDCDMWGSSACDATDYNDKCCFDPAVNSYGGSSGQFLQ